MADGGPLLQLQAAGDLLRTPLLSQPLLHQLPGLPGNARAICFTLPVVRQFVSLIRAISLPPTVAPQLARDGALMTTNHEGNLRLFFPAFSNAYIWYRCSRASCL